MMGLYLGLMLFVHVPSWSWTEPGRWAEQCTPKVCTPPSCTQQNCTRLWQPPTTYTTHCDKSGDLTPACSATRFVDEHLLGWSHMYRTGRFACERAPPRLSHWQLGVTGSLCAPVPRRLTHAYHLAVACLPSH
eukprot:COSAG01_NODE_7664_length_3109_cov_1.665337_2_plen_133_part_00